MNIKKIVGRAMRSATGNAIEVIGQEIAASGKKIKSKGKPKPKRKAKNK